LTGSTANRNPVVFGIDVKLLSAEFPSSDKVRYICAKLALTAHAHR